MSAVHRRTASVALALAFALGSCGGYVGGDAEMSNADKCNAAEVPECAECDRFTHLDDVPACRTCVDACRAGGSECGAFSSSGRLYCTVECEVLNGVCPSGYVCTGYKTEMTAIFTACIPEESR